MKIFKRTLSLFLCTLMLLSAAPGAAWKGMADLVGNVVLTARAADGEICDYTELYAALEECGIEALHLPDAFADCLYNYDPETYAVDFSNMPTPYGYYCYDFDYLFTEETQTAYLRSYDAAVNIPVGLPLTAENQARIDRAAQDLRTAFAQLEYDDDALFELLDITGDMMYNSADVSYLMEHLKGLMDLADVFPGFDYKYLDVNRDGNIDWIDYYTAYLFCSGYIDHTIPAATFQSGASQILLEADGFSGEPGDYFDIPVYVSSDCDLLSFIFQIEYDASAIDVEGLYIDGQAEKDSSELRRPKFDFLCTDGKIQFRIANTRASAIPTEEFYDGTDGMLMWICGSIKENARGGYYPFRFVMNPKDTIESFTLLDERNAEVVFPQVEADLGGVFVEGASSGSVQADPGSDYAGCKLVLRAEGDDLQYTATVRAGGQASIYGVDVEHTYTATLETESGVVFGTVSGVAFSAENNYVNALTFDNLARPVIADLTVLTPDGNDVTASCTFRWIMPNGISFDAGASVPWLTADTQITYEVKLSDALAAQYVAPDAQTATVGADGQLTYTLEPIPTVTVTGSVQTASGTPVRGATVSIVQQTSAKLTRNTATTTDADGAFTAEVADVPLTVTVKKDGYHNTVWSGSAGSLGTFTMGELTGAKLLLDLTATAAGTETETTLSSADNLDFTLTVNGAAASGFTVQYPYLVLREALEDGTEITVAATDRSNSYLPTSATLTYAQDGLNAVSLSFTERGRITVQALSSENAADLCLLFDAGGEYVRSVPMSGLFADSGALDAGSYTLVCIGNSEMIGAVPTLSLLSEYGLQNGSDYISKTVTVENGQRSQWNGFTIPRIDETKLYKTDPLQTSFRVNGLTVSVGQNVLLRAAYGFSDDKAVANAAVKITLPDACELVYNSVTLDGHLVTNFTKSGNTLTVPTGGAKGVVRLYVCPTSVNENMSLSFAASLSCTLDGSAFTQPIGTAQIAVKALDWRVQSKAARRQMTITGKTAANAAIELFDNDILVGTATANSAGSFTIPFELVGQKTREDHELYVQVTLPSGITAVSQTKHVSYNQNYSVLKKATMRYGSYEIVFDFLDPSKKPSSYVLASSGTGVFSFEVEIETNHPEELTNVCVVTYNSMQVQTRVPVTYQENGIWTGTQTYTSSTMPYALRVEYDEPEYIDDENMDPPTIADDLSGYLMETSAAVESYNHKQSAIQAVMNQMDVLLSDNNSTIQAIASLNAELFALLDMDPDEFTVDLSDLTEQELAAYIAQLEDEIEQTKEEVLEQGEAPAWDEDLGSFGNCTGMTAESLIEEGYIACETESGNSVYCKTDETQFCYADLENDLFWQLDLSSGTADQGQRSKSKRAKASGDDEWDWSAFRERVMRQLDSLNEDYGIFRTNMDTALAVINENILSYNRLIIKQTGEIEKATRECHKAWAAIQAAERQPNAYLNMQKAKRAYKEACDNLKKLEKNQDNVKRLRDKYDSQLKKFNKADLVAKVFTLCTVLRDYANDILRLVPLWQSIPNPCNPDKDNVSAIKRDIIAMGASFTLYAFANSVFALVDIATVNPLFIAAMVVTQTYSQEWMNKKSNAAINALERDIKMLQCSRKLTLDPEKMTMKIGESRWVLPVFDPPEYASALNWMSMNENVVTVDQNGHVTAVGEGTTSILAYYADTANEMGGYCTVTVKDKKDDDDDGGNGDNDGSPKLYLSPAPTQERRTYDPSGYVCEAVPSNRLEGVTVTCFYSPYPSGADAEVWDAADYDQQNPLQTDSNGYYEWFVPEGWWQVRYEKNGYVTGYSDWLPVPPPQTEVHYAMTSTALPQVASVNAYSDSVELQFTQYMDLTTVNDQTVIVLADGAVVPGTIVPVNAEASFANADVQYASVFKFLPDAENALSGNVNVQVSNVKNYAGNAMHSSYFHEQTLETRVESVEVEQNVTLESGESRTLTFSVLPVEAGVGKTVIVSSDTAPVASVSPAVVVTDANGTATVTLKGELPGTSRIAYSVDGTDVSGVTTVMVNAAQETCKPVKASIASGSTVMEGTTVTLSTATAGAQIFYTTDGTCPCIEDSPSRILYTGPITLTESVRIIAYAVKKGCNDSGNTVLNYTVNPKMYTIRWYMDNDVLVQEIARGADIVTPADPAKEGYTFTGWTPEVPDAMPAENLDFTAQFSANRYTLTFNAAGGVCDPATKTVVFDTLYGALPVPQRSGYVFDDWRAEDLTVISEQSIVRTASDQTLVADWTMLGDVLRDDSINLKDVALLTRYLVGGWDTSGIHVSAGDADRDGEINLKDAVLIRRYLAEGWNIELI